ncbi:hypothetical protein HDU83_003700 [Entophlyctis luteolus]|nr:hypothetical protein HDU83_003700 [Entophlyctis luteolus]KAJ3383449.1 hypothetical protein HDU84_003616 [Entophlyctis sp. JEL0112]
MSAIEHTSSNMRVVKGESGEYTSKLVSTVSLKPGQVFASAHAMAPVAAKRYSTVQTGADCHAELNSDLLYMNHSCDPNVVLDVEHKIVAAAKDIRPGDAITFFYPSTEWEMDQPFECWCGAPNVRLGFCYYVILLLLLAADHVSCVAQCLKEVKGAKFLDAKTLDKFAISKHIRRMVELRDAATVTLKQE